MSACGCKTYCGDVPEEQDAPDAICKALPSGPQTRLVEVVLVARNPSPTDS